VESGVLGCADPRMQPRSGCVDPATLFQPHWPG